MLSCIPPRPPPGPRPTSIIRADKNFKIPEPPPNLGLLLIIEAVCKVKARTESARSTPSAPSIFYSGWSSHRFPPGGQCPLRSGDTGIYSGLVQSQAIASADWLLTRGYWNASSTPTPSWRPWRIMQRRPLSPPPFFYYLSCRSWVQDPRRYFGSGQCEAIESWLQNRNRSKMELVTSI